jgi:hypothetical protein
MKAQRDARIHPPFAVRAGERRIPSTSRQMAAATGGPFAIAAAQRRTTPACRIRGMPAALFAFAVVAACTPAAPSTTPGPEVTTMQLTSDAFAEGASIPAEHTCDGADISPPLAWDGVPDGTQSFALIVDDPDARGFVHWVLTNIPGEARELPAGEGDEIGTPGPTSFGRTG